MNRQFVFPKPFYYVSRSPVKNKFPIKERIFHSQKEAIARCIFLSLYNSVSFCVNEICGDHKICFGWMVFRRGGYSEFFVPPQNRKLIDIMLTPHELMQLSLKKVTYQLYLCDPIRMDEETICLSDEHISHIINSGNFDNETVVVSHGMKYFHPHWPHTGQKQPEWLWEQIRIFVLDALANPEAKIACHCIAGGQRSATTVYLALRLQGHEIEEAHAMIDAVTTNNPTYSHFVDDWLEARKSGSFPIAVG